jgi:hypothetical protein
MAEPRSLVVYQSYQDAMGKVDNFVTGVSAALVGYLGTQVVMGPLGWNPQTLQVAALVALVGATYCGVMRMEYYATLLGSMHDHLHEEEEFATLVVAASSGRMLQSSSTGQVVAPAQATAQAKGHKAEANAILQGMNSTGAKAMRWYKWRDRFLITGLGLLAASRLLALLAG